MAFRNAAKHEILTASAVDVDNVAKELKKVKDRLAGTATADACQPVIQSLEGLRDYLASAAGKALVDHRIRNPI